MPKYEFIERVHIYYTVDADSVDQAWKELDKLNIDYDTIKQKGSVDIIDCEINHTWENENA